MNGGNIFETVEITLRNYASGDTRSVWINIEDSSLARRWLSALNDILEKDLHLEKNFCFMGWLNNPRNGELILDSVNASIDAINSSGLDYHIDDWFTLDNTITDEPDGRRRAGRNLIHARMNHLHRYFEDLQGVSGAMSTHYERADTDTRWHIRQLNLLCHEFESWALSYRKEIEAPEWICPSQLMCWLNAPRFELCAEDLELFGIETLDRTLGDVYVGVNKAVGKHHWEVFHDEGRDSRIDELTTSTLRSQTEAAGDFDIEWGRSVGHMEFKQRELEDFRTWLTENGFDPEDPELTIGHPRIGRVDLERSFGTEDPHEIWKQMENYLDVYSVSTSQATAIYNYHWSDPDYQTQQTRILR